MEDVGEKTPVSKLQEYMVSMKMFPHYELIHNGVGTHNPTFVYRVQAGALWEEASGRSKKEAKHRAAEKMLKSLNTNDSVDEEDTGEYSNEPVENFVGQLKELCKIQCYPEPKYCLEESAGPPHCKTFRMLCCVSQLQDFGISSTKKQAKHQAAWKMLQRLKELKGNTHNIFPAKMETGTEVDKNHAMEKAVVSNDKVIDTYNALRPATAPTMNKDPTVFYKDHHKAYIGLQETSPTLSQILSGSIELNNKNSLKLISDLAQELEVTLSTSKVPTVDNKSFVVMSVSVFPPLAGIGITEEIAAFNLLNSFLLLC